MPGLWWIFWFLLYSFRMCTTAADKCTLSSLDMSSLTFEKWIMFPWSFPNQFLWWNCQALASAPSKQTAASCNLHKVLFSFLRNAFPCSSPYNPFLIRIDNFYCDFSSPCPSLHNDNFIPRPYFTLQLWDCWNKSFCYMLRAWACAVSHFPEAWHVLNITLACVWMQCACRVGKQMTVSSKSPVGDAHPLSKDINNSQWSHDWVYWKWSWFCILKALLL